MEKSLNTTGAEKRNSVKMTTAKLAKYKKTNKTNGVESYEYSINKLDNAFLPQSVVVLPRGNC